MQSVYRILDKADLIFWDFDGVIKDSVEVKSKAFEQLFLAYGRDVATRVRIHHEANGGMSRFDKLPIYLRWAKESDSAANVDRFCGYFSSKVMQAVINSPWVPGVREYLESQYSKKEFVLVTATPKDEITDILSTLQIEHCFHKVYGAPIAKDLAISQVLKNRDIRLKGDVLMIGDSSSDFEAAENNGIPFLLRRTSLNKKLQESYSCAMFENLLS